MHTFDEMTEPELKQLLNRLADTVTRELPADTGFIVLAAPFDGAIAQYVANAHRGDCIKWLRETADRLEREEDVTR